MAAAEQAVDATQQNHVIDAAIVRKSLLRFIDDGDLETAALLDDEVVTAHARSTAAASGGGEHRRSFHVWYEGRWWSWSQLVRALDGYITEADRGRQSRFWNVMAAHYQSLAAGGVARATATTAREAALEDDDDLEDADVEADPAELRGASVRAGDVVTIWLVGSSATEPGNMAFVRVRALFARGPNVGYKPKVELDISCRDAGWLNGDLLLCDGPRLALRTSGVRFIKVATADVVQRVDVQSTEHRGVLELGAVHAAALQLRQPELREAAIAAASERAAAKARAKAVADQVKRVAGHTDVSKLTVDLIKEELRLRRARGEDIPKLPTSRGQALDMLAAARRTAPDIPAPPAPAPVPLPVVVVEATA